MLQTACTTLFDQDLAPILESPGRWESRGDSSSFPEAPVLSGRIRPGWSCRWIPEWPRDGDPAAPDGSLPQQLGNWHENQELQVGCFWTCSFWQMASLCAGPQPVISRGSLLPVFHIQFQLSAFNFAEDWRGVVGCLFFFFFFSYCKQKMDQTIKGCQRGPVLSKQPSSGFAKYKYTNTSTCLCFKKHSPSCSNDILIYKLC